MRSLIPRPNGHPDDNNHFPNARVHPDVLLQTPETFPRPKGPTPTIYAIKAAQPASSRFFSRENMRFAGQTLKSFSVSWNADVGAWESVAGRWDRDGKYMGNSVHCWQVGTLKHLGSLDACLRTVATERVNKK